MRRLFFIFCLLPVFLFAQEGISNFPSDTSFTVWSAAQKIKKDFPQAVSVKKNQSNSIIEKPDLVYFSIGKRDLHADIFYPAKMQKKIPVVLLIHGGGWASGNKSHLVPMAQKLAENGFFAVTAEQRLSPEAKYPAAINDLKTAIKWMKSNAFNFNIDTAKVAVLGCSSGATVATFLGVSGMNSKFQSHKFSEKVSDKVQAIINIDGIVDFTDPAESGKDSNPLKPSAGARWLGFTFSENPEIWVEASPLSYVNENTPPTLFINSSLPRFHAGRDDFLEVLNNAGIYNKLISIPNTPHPFWLFHPWFDKTWPEIVDFLNFVFSR